MKPGGKLPEPPARNRLWDDLTFGVMWALVVAVALCLWVTVLYLIAGSEPFSENHTTYMAVIATYLTGGVGAGVMLGLLRPIVHRRWGACLAGGLAAIPLALAIRVSQEGFAPWVHSDTMVIVVFGGFMGPAVGYNFWKKFGGG